MYVCNYCGAIIGRHASAVQWMKKYWHLKCWNEHNPEDKVHEKKK